MSKASRILLVSIGIAVAVSGCGARDGPNSTDGSTVEQAARSAQPARSVSDFRGLIPGNWSRAVVTCPDVPEEAVRRELAVNWRESSDHVPVADGQQVVVIVQGDKVSRVDTSSRKSIDLCGGSKYPRTVKPSTKVELSEQKWSDGTTYLQAAY